MPPRALLRSFVALWLVAGGTLFAFSVDTLARSSSFSSQPNLHVALLAGVETVAAVLFLIPRTMRLGGAGLLATLGFAFVAHSLSGDFLPQLVLFGCVVGFVMTHGLLTPEQWRQAMSRRPSSEE